MTNRKEVTNHEQEALIAAKDALRRFERGDSSQDEDALRNLIDRFEIVVSERDSLRLAWEDAEAHVAALLRTPTPTDDEREAITLIVRDVHNYDGRPSFLSLSGADAGRIADAIIAAGFRLSVASEPNVETWICGKCGGSAYEHSLTTSTCIWEPIETRSEPQREPSDAQVTAAMIAYHSAYLDRGIGYSDAEDNRVEMRAALRAAGVVS